MHFNYSSEFCHDPFWDNDLSWNNPEPKFSTCFKNSLVLIPISLLWVSSVLWITWFNWDRSKSKDKGEFASGATVTAKFQGLRRFGFWFNWDSSKIRDLTWQDLSGICITKLLLNVLLFGVSGMQICHRFHQPIYFSLSDMASSQVFLG